MAILTGEPRSATIRAIRDTELVRLSQDSLDRLIEKHPQALRQLTRIIISRLQKQNQLSRQIGALTTIAIAPATQNVPLSEFATHLSAALAVIGATLHLQREILDQVLGQGASLIPHGDPRNSEVVAWLNEQEAKYQFVVYEADSVPSQWTRRCLRQADRVLLVGQAGTTPTPSEFERAFSQLSPDATAVRTDVVLLHGHLTRFRSGAHDWLTSLGVSQQHHVRVSAPEDFARLARILTGRAVGLVLGGGGARGFAHIGVIRALTEAGIPIDVIGGASMGAVIAAQYALGWDYNTMLAVNRKGWIESRPLSDYTVPLVSLLVGNRMLKMLTMMFADKRIEDLWLPYFCVSSNLTRAEVMVHREGLLRHWLGASIAVPGIGPPFSDQGDLLVDGGVLNNLPIDVMRNVSTGSVIAVDVSPPVDKTMTADYQGGVSGWRLLWHRLFSRTKLAIPSLFEILLRTTTLSSAHSTQRMSDQADLYLRPPVESFGKFEWNALEQIAAVGYEYAQQKITEWKSAP